MWTPSSCMPARMPLAMICGNSGPTGAPDGLGPPCQRNPDMDTPTFRARSRSSWSTVARSACCSPHRRSVMPNSESTASYASTTCLCDEPLGLEPDLVAGRVRCLQRERRRPFADGSRPQHVVAEELELVLQAFAELGELVLEPAEGRDVALVVQEVHLQPYGCQAVTVQRQPGVVHPVVVERRERVRWLRVTRSRRNGHQCLVEQAGDPD